MNRRSFLVALIVMCGIAGGCNKEARDELADKLKQSADTVAEQAGQATEAAARATQQVSAAVDPGSIQIEMQDTPVIAANTCYGQWLTFSDGRPSVLQLASYSDAEQETFPSIFVRAIVDPSVTEIFNQTLKAKVFVQPVENGPVYYTLESGPVNLDIGPQSDTITATLVDGQLVCSDDGTVGPLKGTLTFSLK